MRRVDLSKVGKFEWDKGNIEKNKKKHNVDTNEAEEAITNNPIFFDDKEHSEVEERYIALGPTNNKRFLFVSFTVRKEKIRVMSARDQDKKEKGIYERLRKEATKENEKAK